MSGRRSIPWWGAGALVGVGIAAVDGPALWGWFAYATIGAAAGEGLRRLWRAVVADQPAPGLAAALVLGFALRLGLGLAWLGLLPSFGNDVTHHHAGTFFPDAFVRDRSAWAIGRSDVSLLDAFDSAKGDQYGTLLFGTAVVYRVFGPEVQTTFLPTALAALFGTAAILLTWGFARRAFGAAVALCSVWFVALYPESILLGSQSMREPYVMAGVAAALYGYALARGAAGRGALVWIAGGCLLNLVVSPPFGIATAVILGLGWLWEGRVPGPVGRWAMALVAGALVLAMALTIRAWSGLIGGTAQPLDAISTWLTGGGYELSRLQAASGWVEQIFGRTPEWSHVPLATLYGLIQPFLPAAVMDNSGVLLMRIVMVLRSLGWFFVLPVLLYTPVAAVRREGWRSLPAFLAFVTLASAILISYRFAGDQWDSPRYRAALSPALAALVGWAWVASRLARDRWLAWLALLVAVETVVVGWWYAGRYYHVPRLSLERTLVVAAVAGSAVLVWAAVAERRRSRLTGNTPAV